jgi:hypothetical protein
MSSRIMLSLGVACLATGCDDTLARSFHGCVRGYQTETARLLTKVQELIKSYSRAV